MKIVFHYVTNYNRMVYCLSVYDIFIMILKPDVKQLTINRSIGTKLKMIEHLMTFICQKSSKMKMFGYKCMLSNMHNSIDMITSNILHSYLEFK